jgi:uncharacterized membrane protein
MVTTPGECDEGFMHPSIPIRLVEKKSIEDLSNLVFGLALTLGALTLVAPSHDDYLELLSVLLRFALGFFIIVFVWWLYNATITQTDLGEGNRFLLNLLLLLLVVIEPFLLTIANSKSGATAYAIDLGAIMGIQVAFTYFIEHDERERLDVARLSALRVRRRILVGCCALFFISIIPVIVLPMPDGENFSGLIWLGILLIVPAQLLRRNR